MSEDILKVLRRVLPLQEKLRAFSGAMEQGGIPQHIIIAITPDGEGFQVGISGLDPEAVVELLGLAAEGLARKVASELPKPNAPGTSVIQ